MFYLLCLKNPTVFILDTRQVLHLDHLILCCQAAIQKLHLLSVKFFCHIVACLRDLETCLQAIEQLQAVPHTSTEFDCTHGQFA